MSHLSSTDYGFLRQDLVVYPLLAQTIDQSDPDISALSMPASKYCICVHTTQALSFGLHAQILLLRFAHSMNIY